MRLAPVLGLTLITMACAPAAKTPAAEVPTALTAEDVVAVQAVDAAFAAGMNAKDTLAVFDIYTADAKLMPPDAPILEGAGLRAVIAGLVNGGATDFKLTPISTHGAGDIAYTIGTATMVMGGKTESIKYAEVLRKGADGKWRYAVDMFSSVAPATPAPAAAK
jgi:ketosteroid isomerase-like protein